MPLLFSLQQPLSELKDSLLTEFAGRELMVSQIYERHSVDRPFILKNYKAVLADMEANGLIAVRSSKVGNRRKGTFADHHFVRFPERSGNG